MNLQMLLFLSVYRELFTVDWLQPIGFAENLDELPDIYAMFLHFREKKDRSGTTRGLQLNSVNPLRYSSDQGKTGGS